MVSDRDILEAAQALIRQHGPAAIEAARDRARTLTAEDDEAGAAIWRLIEQAVDDLTRTAPGPDDRVM